MTITLYSNMSPPNYVNKTITQVDVLNGTLREACSIVDPVITIERANPTGFNYAYINEFSRYYFVTGVSSEVNGIIAVAMHVDVLMTYKSQIASAKGIVRRQENQFNTYLDDGIYKAYQNSKHKIIAFPGSFSAYSYVLALAGNSDNSS